MNFFEELKERDLIYDFTSEEKMNLLDKEKFSFYLGCDPTGNSLHVGHLVTYITAKRLEMMGHNPIILVGGATGLIGDPKLQGERKMISLETSLENAQSLKEQIQNVFGFKTLVNNYDWVSKINIIEYLRDYGKYFNVNNMISKDIVSQRLESGISYTEFSYQIIQSLDWLHLYENYNCQIQIGGQDQWGNITSGTDLIRKKIQKEAFGFTIPLILKSDGTKFGKSEDGKSVWLSSEKTTVYQFYQFWLNTKDTEVIKRLKQFTFLSLDEIKEIEKNFQKDKSSMLAQKILAKEITTYVHGKKNTQEAIILSEKLFNDDIKSLTSKEIEDCFSDLYKIDGNNLTLVDALVSSNLATSKREAREFIKNNAITLNGSKVCDLDLILTKDLAIDNKYIILKRGKKNYSLVYF